MSLSSAKAKLDAQGGDPATGYISKTDHKDSYDELLADTALTGATTAAAVAVSGAVTVGTTLNGRDPDDLAKGPATATDNALVRFDGTDGKTVQNSGITVDDSGNITSNLTISKASAQLYLNATSGTGLLLLGGAAASAKRVYCLTAGNNRWAFGSDTTAESGSNAGSDFGLLSYTDAGALLRTDLTVNRATGKTTLGSVGATAGLELGSSGPRVMSGTGSPESVVTAPVGSTWTDTAATTGAIQWIKASGTGNTGWVVQYGDTGSRDISSVLTADADRTLASTILLRRTGNWVVLSGVWRETTTTPNNRAFYSLPVGFRPAQTLYQYIPYDAAATTAYRNIRVPANGGITYGGPTSGSNFEYCVRWTTVEAWPSSLPGSAA